MPRTARSLTQKRRAARRARAAALKEGLPGEAEVRADENERRDGTAPVRRPKTPREDFDS